jgi:hypothetical protein
MEGYLQEKTKVVAVLPAHPSTRDFEIWLKGALEVQRLSLWELFEGNLEGGFPCWG